MYVPGTVACVGDEKMNGKQLPVSRVLQFTGEAHRTTEKRVELL